MQTIKTDIIPKSPTLVTTHGAHELDLKAICAFVSTGFFLDDDTYWKNKKVLAPASKHTFADSNKLINSKPWFQWYYNPRNVTFKRSLDEFENLFEGIMKEQTKDKAVILPLSGGLDSRTQAVALKNHPQVHSFSYAFHNGYPEHIIARQIAKKSGFEFEAFKVSKGYLWDCIEDLAEINQCYTDFTHPRQMAFADKYLDMGAVFSLGHWGDVLFDSFNLPQLSTEEQIAFIIKKLVVKGGMELATSLWKTWSLNGSFKGYLIVRIEDLLKRIHIDDTNAKIRAFKSLYWATRWTAVNLSVFESVLPITMPYYDNKMCEFICTIPESFLKDRQLQIAYIKRNAPELSNITWHAQKPFNLNNFHLNRSPYNLPYRITNKLKREFNRLIGKPYVSRNWELQYFGKENDKHLKNWLFEAGLDTMIPKEVIQQYYTNFKEKNAVKYAHPVSMLLTLALFNKKFNK